jgi:predicted anti-sigma-YlaC factor YlaD
MTCRKVRQLIPLAAGDDLGPRRAAAFRAHLDACPGCRAELEAFRAELAGIRAAAKETVADWSGSEWGALMGRVRAEAQGTGPRRAAGPVFAPRWAAASVIGAVLGLVVMGVLFRGPSPRPDTAASAGERTLLAAGPGEQDRLTMTLVSPETGLQIVWTFDKNFDWKGDQQ